MIFYCNRNGNLLITLFCEEAGTIIFYEGCNIFFWIAVPHAFKELYHPH